MDMEQENPMKLRLFAATCASLAVVAAVYLSFPDRPAYSTDLIPHAPAHFFAGAAVGFAALWLGFWIGLFPIPWKPDTRIGSVSIRYEGGIIPKWVTAVVVALAIGLVGLGWEVWEVIRWTWVGVPFTPAHITDTILDLFTDTAGAFSAWAIAHRFWITKRGTDF